MSDKHAPMERGVNVKPIFAVPAQDKQKKSKQMLTKILCLAVVACLALAPALAVAKPECMANVWFDIEIGSTDAGRIEMCLFANTPVTGENFRQLATGEAENAPGYAGTIFHRIVPGFMLQAGDTVRMEGWGRCGAR